jgi:hypothetical protein
MDPSASALRVLKSGPRNNAETLPDNDLRYREYMRPNLGHDFSPGITSRRSNTPGGGIIYINGALQISLNEGLAFN